MPVPVRSTVLACAAACLLPSCSPQSAAEARPDAAREFSAQDKAAARALSLGTGTAAQLSDDPYERSLLCSNAVTLLLERLTASGQANGQVLQALQQAQRIYAQRTRALGDARGKSSADVEREATQASATLETNTMVRASLGCLNELRPAQPGAT